MTDPGMRDTGDVAFGEQVRVHRAGRRLSQERLAERAGLSVQHVGRVERADRSPSLRVARALAAGLGVPLADLLSPSADAQSDRAAATHRASPTTTTATG